MGPFDKRTRIALMLGVLVAGLVGGCGGTGSTSQPSFTPVLVNSQLAVGPNRFALGLIDPVSNLPIVDARVSVTFTGPPGAASAPFTASPAFVFSIPGERGVYLADATFPAPGEWSAAVTVSRPGQTEQTRTPSFSVLTATSYPSVGKPAVKTRTPTAASVAGDLAKISTDPKPDPTLYEKSVDELVGVQPFVLVFSTPKFCTSRVCGPLLDKAKAVRGQFPTVAVIHVEPFDLAKAAQGLLEPVPSVTAWGLPSEPWAFVIDRSGIVRAAYEGVITGDDVAMAARAVAG